MALYHCDELTFDAPDGWVDRSINMFASPSGEISLNVTRDDLAGEPVGPWVAKQLKRFEKNWPRFLLIGQRERRFAGSVGWEARLQWGPEGAFVYQHQSYVPYYGRVIIVTATSPKRLAAQCDVALEALLDGLRLRRQA
jgi:hypothetical protein